MKFTKMHAYGNDYVYVPLFEQEMDDPSRWARFLSRRRFGVGGDGMVLICPSEKADFRMRVFNPDGSEAEMCGNALRSTGMWLYEKGRTKKEVFTVETLAGIKTIYLQIEGGHVADITAAIGAPAFEREKVPVTLSDADGNCLGVPLRVLDKTLYINAVSLGNPHCVIFVDDVLNFDVTKYGRAVEHSDVFPQRANVEFVQALDSGNLRLRTWERGCGETMACGTGCSASTVCGFMTGRNGAEVTVHQLGGDIKIRYDTRENCIYMTGGAVIVYDGEVPSDAVPDVVPDAVPEVVPEVVPDAALNAVPSAEMGTKPGAKSGTEREERE